MALSDATRKAIRTAVEETLTQKSAIAKKEAARHQRRIEAIEAHQAKLVQMYLDDLASEDVLRKKQAELKLEKETASRLLAAAESTMAEVQAPLEAALELATDPQATYLRATATERRMLNAAFFERIEVGIDGELIDVKLMPVFEAMKAWQPSLGEPAKGRSFGPQVRSWSPQVHCCSKSKPWSAKKRTGFAVASPNRPTDTSVSISGVPTICRFFGITITMYFDDHDPPHFHARHASDGAKIEIESLEIMDSTLERRQLRFVLAWAELHQDELLANWRRARAGETLEDIEPLR